jgi:hypothetical protein
MCRGGWIRKAREKNDIDFFLGPFGFIEKFEYTWNMWLGGGEHFSFMNQPTAGTKNFQSFVSAVITILDKEDEEKALEIAEKHEEGTIGILLFKIVLTSPFCSCYKCPECRLGGQTWNSTGQLEY